MAGSVPIGEFYRVHGSSALEVEFGSFRFDPYTRVLREGDRPVHLGGRALALLSILIEVPGRLVSKGELFDRAWPGLNVEESNLKVQISALRKALKDQGIAVRAEASLGYRFLADVKIARRQIRAPSIATKPIGRNVDIERVVGLLEANRVVSLLGPGGIGKTTVALAVANELLERFEGDVCFADLSRISVPSQMYGVVADALDLPLTVPTIEQLLLALKARKTLLVLDSCEHVVEIAAHFVERTLSFTSDVCVLVTTREPLRIVEEATWRLNSLETPPFLFRATLTHLKQFSSVQLFIETAIRTTPRLEISDEAAQHIAEICRSLDGIPLAIEIAASMVGSLGIDEVRRGLDARFSLLDLGRRSFTPRQRSLAATIDWSYQLLPEKERTVLRRLALFAGQFTMEECIAVAVHGKISLPDVRNAVAELVNKSFLNLTSNTAAPEYRLFDTTRAYVSELIGPDDECLQTQKRHARYFLDLLEARDWERDHCLGDRAKIRNYMAEVHVALDWAFEADPDLGVRLALAAERLWLELSSISAGVPYLLKAQRHLEGTPDCDAVLRSRVLVSLACTQGHFLTLGENELTFCHSALEAARGVDDQFLKIRALHALIFALLQRSFPISPYLEELEALAKKSRDPAIRYLPLSLTAYRDVELSDLVSTRINLETFVTQCAYVSREFAVYFGFQILMCEVTLALTKYWMGHCEEAERSLALLISEAEHQANFTILCFGLAHGALWCSLFSGDLESARQYHRKLEYVASLYTPWQGLSDAYRALLMQQERGDLNVAHRLLTQALEDGLVLKQGGLVPLLMFQLSEIQLSLGHLDSAEEMLARAMSFCSDERDARIIGRHHCILARVLLSRGAVEQARALFRRAIQVTCDRNIIVFEIQATIGLANLEIESQLPSEAIDLVEPLLARARGLRGVPGLAALEETFERASRILSS